MWVCVCVFVSDIEDGRMLLLLPMLQGGREDESDLQCCSQAEGKAFTGVDGLLRCV